MQRATSPPPVECPISNCATLPANLIESELFGHEKGSYTGATERRIGKFELADGSTIFLDEIEKLSINSRMKKLGITKGNVFIRKKDN